VHDVDHCVDRRGRQDRRRDEDRHQDRLHPVRHQDHQDVRHQDRQGRQDEDQNQDVHPDRQDHQGHPNEDRRGHQDQDGIRQDHRGVRHQDQDELRDHQVVHQDQDGNRLDQDVMYQVPCADQEVAECADLWKTQDQEVVGLVGDQQGDAHQEAFQLVACREATGHVQRGALGVSLEAD
jgi:hypothetical protein